MNAFPFSFAGETLHAMGSGALWWPSRGVLCVSDLHLGKSERIARRGGPTLPPYDSRDTLTRLATDIEHTGATTVICLGDSFDDLQASGALEPADRLTIAALQAGRRWIWLEGNHDPGPVDLGGSHLSEFDSGLLVFRHIAQSRERPEISGHYHPKVRVSIKGRSIARPAFLVDETRLILPSYGTYTGGLRSTDQALICLMEPNAKAILTGVKPAMVPMPR